jgi:hypothetical protein
MRFGNETAIREPLNLSEDAIRENPTLGSGKTLMVRKGKDDSNMRI